MNRAGRRSERGASAVELALVLPGVLLLILGILQYGYMYWSLETAAASAREAARRLAVGTSWEECARDEAIAKAASPAIGSSAAADAPSYTDAQGAPVSGPEVGGLVSVTIRLQTLDLNIPLLPMPNDAMIAETAEARVQYVPRGTVRSPDPTCD